MVQHKIVSSINKAKTLKGQAFETRTFTFKVQKQVEWHKNTLFYNNVI